MTTGLPPEVTSELRSSSLAISTLYFAAPGTGSQRRTSGSAGNEIVAASSGDVRLGESAQSFSIERDSDHADVLPLASTACTRHQYEPFASVLSGVTRVFFVPSTWYTGELKAESAARTKLYLSAPETGFHEKTGRNETVAPAGGPMRLGALGALAAGAIVMSATASAARKTRGFEYVFWRESMDPRRQ